jgi:hypothetical protein
MNPLSPDLIPFALELTKLLPAPNGSMIFWAGLVGRASTGISYVGISVDGTSQLVVDPRDPLLVGALVEMLRVKRGDDFPTFPINNTNGTWSICIGRGYVSGMSPVEALLAALVA